MFTGIVQEQGRILKRNKSGKSITFSVNPFSESYLKDVRRGDSISVNGACMTVENRSKKMFEFTAVNESLSKTNLGNLKINDVINLEKAMTLDSKLDGHIVQGHVDSTGIVKKVVNQKDLKEYFIEFSSAFRENIIYVGSIAINGVSLTVAQIVKESKSKILIKIAIIPHTFNVTNFKTMKENDIVNIEFDMLGKYVKRIMQK
jgi:riboflavin synthase